MEQLKRRRQKLVATLMAAVALSGSKVTPPAAAMSQGLSKATTKAATNKKNGLPAWAKWLMIGGGSAVGAAAIAGTIWWCLKGKNKDQKIPDEKNEEIPVKLKGSKMDSEKKNKKNKSKLYPIKEEDESEEEDNNKESKDESVDINKKDENAFEEQPKREDFPIIYNTIEDKENEEKQKEEEKAKRKAEKQENENAFYEAVEKYNLLSKFMNALKNYNQHTKSVVGIYKYGKLSNDIDSGSLTWALGMYKNFRKDISVNGKKIKIEHLKNEANNVDYKIIFDGDMYYNIVILGYKRMAIKAMGANGVLFEFQNDIV